VLLKYLTPCICATALVLGSPNYTISAELSSTFDTTGKFAGSYLCIPDAAGGVYFDEASKRWQGAIFNVEDKKLVVSIKVLGLKEYKILFSTLSEMVLDYEVKVSVIGREGLYCNTPNGEPLAIYESGIFQCGLLYKYRFDLNKLRYVEFYTAGFVDGIDNNDNTPAVTVGRCSKFSE
jgi:hypothetical protein